VRIVHQEDNFLTYSPEPAFSLVLYINQATDDEGNRRMKKTTEQLIDLTIAHKGRFFLPYQLYYSRDQLKRSYPQIDAFFAAKRKFGVWIELSWVDIMGALSSDAREAVMT